MSTEPVPLASLPRILVAGGDTLIGAAIARTLAVRGTPALAFAAEPDWTRPEAVEACFRSHRPEQVYLCAGMTGGIQENRTRPATLMLHNLLASTHLLEAALRHRTGKLLYLASSCSYPRLCPQPMHPRSLMTGPLEPTNEAYATAKLAGLALVKALRQEHGCRFIAGIPANAFGPGDDFDPDQAHVIGALLHRMHTARLAGDPEVVVWGSGRARREFVFADDLARACLLAMAAYEEEEPLNLGAGSDLSIAELAELIRGVVGYRGALRFDPSRPDGMPLKRLDSSALEALGHRGTTPMPEALAATYQDYLRRHAAS